MLADRRESDQVAHLGCATDGLASISVNNAAAQVSDPQAWVEESADLAKQFAYAPRVRMGKTAVMLTRDYETSARNIARSQAALAAARLANLINEALK
nr:S1/P1 nuclease [Bradyrhizobium sp. dw_78]